MNIVMQACRFSLIVLSLVPILAQAAPSAAITDPLKDKVIVNGKVPDEAARAAIIGRLRALYGSGRVINQLEIGGVSPPPNWSNYATAALTDSLIDVHTGQLTIDGNKVHLSGTVANAAQREQVAMDVAKAFNETYTVDNALDVKPDSQALLDQTLADRVVEFKSGSATLTMKGRRILDEIAAVINQLGSPNIQVIGHTDSTGLRLSNIGLSLLRADSVKRYLTNKGIPQARITALGAGPDHPITTNATAAGRARNRRIEFRTNH